MKITSVYGVAFDVANRHQLLAYDGSFLACIFYLKFVYM